MSAFIGKIVTFLPLAIFALGFLYTTASLIALEPYQRIVVGATVDTGSRIISLLGPTAVYMGAIFGVVALVLFLAFKGLTAAIEQSPTLKKLADA